MTPTLQSINIPPQTDQPPKGLIVTLHGWGANAEDVAYLLPFLGYLNINSYFLMRRILILILL